MSVTSTAKSYNQSKYGIIPLRSFVKTEYDDNKRIWYSSTDTHGDIGTAVDELSRYIYLTRKGTPYEPTESFKRMSDSIFNNKDARISSDFNITRIKSAMDYVTPDNALSDLSILIFYKYIEYAKAVQYHRTSDVFRYEPSLKHSHTRSSLLSNKTKIDGIRIMIERTLSFYDTVNPIEFGRKMILNGVRGEVDFITKDTLFDLKTYGHEITKKDTLQIGTYYVMGTLLEIPIFKHIKYIGIFNARLNKSYILEVSRLYPKKFDYIKDNILFYKSS